MIKRLFGVILIVLMCMILTSCKMSDYSDAMVAVRQNRYEEAIVMFAKLGDYSDSQVQLLNCIEQHANNLLKHHHYDELISLYQQYYYVADFSDQMKDAVIEYSDYCWYLRKFADSIAIYTQYSDIADFSVQQKKAIEKYVNKLLDDDDYAAAISVYQKYSSVADYTSQITELQSKKELFYTYDTAIAWLRQGNISKGFSILETLPKSYRNIDEIYASYDALKDSAFKGSHTMKNSNWTNSQKVDFSFVFHPEYECFCIQADLTVYWSDGTVYSKNTYYGYASGLKDNILTTGRYRWIVNDNGRVTQKDYL